MALRTINIGTFDSGANAADEAIKALQKTVDKKERVIIIGELKMDDGRSITLKWDNVRDKVKDHDYITDSFAKVTKLAKDTFHLGQEVDRTKEGQKETISIKLIESEEIVRKANMNSGVEPKVSTYSLKDKSVIGNAHHKKADDRLEDYESAFEGTDNVTINRLKEKCGNSEIKIAQRLNKYLTICDVLGYKTPNSTPSSTSSGSSTPTISTSEENPSDGGLTPTSGSRPSTPVIVTEGEEDESLDIDEKVADLEGSAKEKVEEKNPVVVTEGEEDESLDVVDRKDAEVEEKHSSGDELTSSTSDSESSENSDIESSERSGTESSSENSGTESSRKSDDESASSTSDAESSRKSSDESGTSDTESVKSVTSTAPVSEDEERISPRAENEGDLEVNKNLTNEAANDPGSDESEDDQPYDSAFSVGLSASSAGGLSDYFTGVDTDEEKTAEQIAREAEIEEARKGKVKDSDSEGNSSEKIVKRSVELTLNSSGTIPLSPSTTSSSTSSSSNSSPSNSTKGDDDELKKTGSASSGKVPHKALNIREKTALWLKKQLSKIEQTIREVEVFLKREDLTVNDIAQLEEYKKQCSKIRSEFNDYLKKVKNLENYLDIDTTSRFKKCGEKANRLVTEIYSKIAQLKPKKVRTFEVTVNPA